MGNDYSTTNFQIAVWLMVNGIDLRKVEWVGRRAEFFFHDFDAREELINRFFEEEQLQRWISATQELKTRMYAEQGPIDYRN